MRFAIFAHEALELVNVHVAILFKQQLIAIAINANWALTTSCDYRTSTDMKRLSDQIIDDFGGLTELAKLVETPTSTANSWRNRITKSRLNHLRLAALAAGKTIRWDTLEDAAELEAPESDAA